MIVLNIGDTHSPFMHRDAPDFLRDLKKEFKPDKIIHAGDEADQHFLGDWGADPDGMSGGDEHKALIQQMKILYKLFPKCEVMESNHGKRPYRRAYKAGIPRAYMKAYRDFMEAPKGWQWHEKLYVDKVLYMHGEGYTGKMGALKAAMDNRVSCVIGHIHTFGGVQYSATESGIIFGANSGCLIDIKKYAFAYGKVYPNKPTLGSTIIIDGKEAIFRRML